VGLLACADDRLTSPNTAVDETSLGRDQLPAITASAVLVGAGNMARCGTTDDEETAKLLDGIAGTVFTTGDNVYDSGSSTDFTSCYQPSWGRHLARTRPAAGDQDYQTAGAAAYFAYFGAAAGQAGKGYYSYDVGDWHIVVLNSNIAMHVGSPQEQWLRADLAASNRQCTLAYWHHPRFSSYSTPVRTEVEPLWDALYDAGAELVINGHYRVYERFAPQDPNGAADPQKGIRQFTVGTGGQGVDAFGTALPNSEKRRRGVHGVLKLTLDAGSYTWTFVPVPGKDFADSGTGSCHGSSGTPTTPAVSTVDVTPAADTIQAGATGQLAAVARDATGNVIANAPMSWLSRDTMIAKVASTGLVTGIAAGSAYIVATSSGRSDSSRITVTPGSAVVAAVSVSPSSANVDVGSTLQLTATPRDAAGNPLNTAITWTSSSSAVAAVNGSGLVTGIVAGNATITATSGGKSGTATISVKVPSTPGPLPGFYVAPNGSSGGDGSMQRPWDLATALSGASGRIRPGNTVWLRGGTYRGKFTSTVSGTAGSPVTIRQYPGERAIVDGAGASGDNFVVRGQWSVFWGFELMNSNTARSTTSLSNSWRPNLLVNNASNTRYINLVIHDGGVAFFTYPTATNVEVYGCILYNNGWQSIDRGHGHALYIKSNTGPVHLRDNVIFNQFGYGVHAYTNSGSGKLNNIHVTGNVAFNNGTLSNNSTSPNILIGGDDTATGDVLTDNLTYFSSTSAGTNVRIGYSTTRNGSVQLQRNTLVGGSTVLEFGYWSSASVSGNTLVGSSSMVRLNDNSTSGKSWGGNTHRRDPSASAWRYTSSSYSFNSWRSATGLAATDQAQSGTPTGTQVIVRPNVYEPGRAMITVFNWSGQGSVNVNLAGVLNAGERYEVYNVQNLFGQPVASGTFGGGSISLPMNGVTPPAPIGMGSSRAPRTGPEFDVFIVRKQ
jgi:hypothetical protein